MDNESSVSCQSDNGSGVDSCLSAYDGYGYSSASNNVWIRVQNFTTHYDIYSVAADYTRCYGAYDSADDCIGYIYYSSGSRIQFEISSPS